MAASSFDGRHEEFCGAVRHDIYNSILEWRPLCFFRIKVVFSGDRVFFAGLMARAAQRAGE
jgi:hypothetical protein